MRKAVARAVLASPLLVFVAAPPLASEASADCITLEFWWDGNMIADYYTCQETQPECWTEATDCKLECDGAPFEERDECQSMCDDGRLHCRAHF